MKTSITKLIALTLLLVLASGLKAQESDSTYIYQSFFGNDSTELNLYYYGIDWGTQYLCKIYSKDTIHINDKFYYFSKPQYLKTEAPYWIYYYPFDDTIYFREDLQNGRLYFYINDNRINPNDVELLICDMSLNVGDMFTLPISFNPGEFEKGLEEEVVVNNIRTENGKKVIDLRYPYDEDLSRYKLIEGIFPPLIPNIYYGDYNYVRCQHNDGMMIYKNPLFSNCFCEMGYDIDENVEKSVFVRPTLFSTGETISISSDSEIKDVKMMDMLGRRIEISLNQTDENSCQISLKERYDSSVYLIIVETKNEVCYKKVVLQD